MFDASQIYRIQVLSTIPGLKSCTLFIRQNWPLDLQKMLESNSIMESLCLNFGGVNINVSELHQIHRWCPDLRYIVSTTACSAVHISTSSTPPSVPSQQLLLASISWRRSMCSSYFPLAA
jgi:hypothetical protein